jgi:hypothetical protein
MDPWWMDLLREQQNQRFADLAGAEASITLPISDRLITRAIAERIPPSAPIRDIDLSAERGNLLTIRIRLAKPPFVPPIQLRLVIEQQPALPESPIVALAFVSRGVAVLAAPVLRLLDVLPAGVRYDGRRFVVDLATILADRGVADALAFLTDLTITTDERRIVVRARGALPPTSAART